MAPSARERRAFVLRKLHSLIGVVPLGAFLVVHLWTNASALQGPAAHEAAMATSWGAPFRAFLIGLGLYLPLAFHALWGLRRTLDSRPTRRPPAGSRHTGYVLQRATGLLLLVFIVVHVAELHLLGEGGAEHPGDHFDRLCRLLSATHGGIPWRAAFYLTGLAAAAYHLANGLRAFCSGWGITRSRRAARRLGVLWAAVGLLLFYVGASTVILFATGLRLVPGTTLAPDRLPPRGCSAGQTAAPPTDPSPPEPAVVVPPEATP